MAGTGLVCRRGIHQKLLTITRHRILLSGTNYPEGLEPETSGMANPGLKM